jgi:hypothetical protein
MKKEIAKKWIKALRSGKYKRGEGFLKRFNSKNQPRHCCLGVLCELYNESMKKNHKKTLTVKASNSGFCPENGYVIFGDRDVSLPPAVKKWAGIKHSTGEFTYIVKDQHGKYKNHKNLSILNDTGNTFKTIANIIEKNIENL